MLEGTVIFTLGVHPGKVEDVNPNLRLVSTDGKSLSPVVMMTLGSDDLGRTMIGAGPQLALFKTEEDMENLREDFHKKLDEAFDHHLELTRKVDEHYKKCPHCEKGNPVRHPLDLGKMDLPPADDSN